MENQSRVEPIGATLLGANGKGEQHLPWYGSCCHVLDCVVMVMCGVLVGLPCLGMFEVVPYLL